MVILVQQIIKFTCISASYKLKFFFNLSEHVMDSLAQIPSNLKTILLLGVTNMFSSSGYTWSFKQLQLKKCHIRSSQKIDQAT